MIQGPNVKKLIAHKMSQDRVPAGGRLLDVVKFLSDKDRILSGARKATEWVELAILAVRQAAEPNPWKTADDETIAGEILRQIATKTKH